MKRLSILLCVVALLSCNTATYAPPPVTVAMTRGKGKDVDLVKLREGRELFVHRCIECHTLPQFWHYSSNDWPKIIDSMAHRAHLTPDDRNAILAYIMAARSLE